MRWVFAVASVLCACLQAAEHRGVVRCGGLPIPGAAVTASRAGQQVTVYTDETGEYRFEDLAPGNWKIEARMAGFDPFTREVNLAPGAAPLTIELRLRPAPTAPQPAPAARPAAPGGFQQVAVAETPQDQVQQALAEPPPEPVTAELAQNANESFLVSGSLSRGLQEVRREDPFTMNREDFRQRLEALRGTGILPQGVENMLGAAGGPPGEAMPGGPGAGMRGGPPMMGGGPGMMGGGPGMRGPGGRGPGGRSPGGRGGFGPPGRATMFGNRSGRARDAIRGGAFFTLRNSALDARPYSISGAELRKPSYAQARFGVTLGGALHIPKIVRDDRTMFFFNYFGGRSRNPFDSLSTLPSALERAGDFSQSGLRGPLVIADAASGAPFPSSRIPLSRINPAASGLLGLFPAPNLPGPVQNYQLLTSVPSNSNNLGVRLNRSLTRRDRLSGGYNFQQRSAETAQLFGFRDRSSGRGQRLDAAWSHTLRSNFFSNLRASFSRNSNELAPYFAFGRDWAADLGIRGTSRDPRNYGPPNLSFTNFGGLTDGSFSLRHDQTVSIGDSFLFVRKQHNLSFGGDYRRNQANSLSQQNARGSYTFSGIATSLYDARGFPLAGTGFDFADFLLGLPQSSTIRFGDADTYFRGVSWSLFAQDDWRVRSNLTINVGLRYDLVRPLWEKYGRMANLDIAPGFTGVSVVTPGVPGPYTGVFPQGLINTDANNLAPRIGIAWRPLAQRRFQVRLGYGWYYNAPVLTQAASRLAQQPPFGRSGSLVTSAARPLTIEDGFAQVPNNQVTNSYAVDRYYRAGYAQTWNLSVQQDLPHSLMLELGYLGTKGTRLDMQRWPNRTPTGSALTAEERARIGNATGFTFDSSEANSIFHSGQLRLTRRFRRGISANALYTYGKSIDNASSIGGGGGVVAQDDRDLRAERGLSSFDRRHSLNLFYVFTTAAGRRGASGFPAGAGGALLRDWTLTGGVTVRSGGPFTAQVMGNRSDQGGAGTIGSGRADSTGLPVQSGPGFFNLAAFTVPPAGRYGNASRNTIPGPGFFSMNLSFGRTLHWGERRSADLRLEANNLLNSVNISRIGTTVNSVNYGLAQDASAMRSLTCNLRMRF